VRTGDPNRGPGIVMNETHCRDTAIVRETIMLDSQKST